MFKHITIHLTGPVCKCDEQNLIWAIGVDSGLVLTCKKCRGCLTVPRSQLGANFTFEQPYPGKQVEKTSPNLKAMDGGKVLLLNVPRCAIDAEFDKKEVDEGEDEKSEMER